MLAARVLLVQRHQLIEHQAPRGRLLLGVIDARQRLPVLMVERQIRKVLAPLAVHLIREARMVRVQFGTVRQDLIGEAIEVANTTRKPRHRTAILSDIPRNDAEVAALLLQPFDRLAQLAVLAVALDKELVAGHTVRRARLDVDQIHIVLVDDAQTFGEGAARRVVLQRKDQKRAGAGR